jgi:hypothetical protein
MQLLYRDQLMDGASAIPKALQLIEYAAPVKEQNLGRG